MRGKILIKKRRGNKLKIKVRCLIVLPVVVALVGVVSVPTAQAAACPDVRVVFARGSGGERWKDPNYLEYKATIESKLARTDLTYEFVDLDYPAVGVGVDKLRTTVGAFFGGGEAYEFGESVKSGVKNLDKLVNSSECPATKYVVGGYSQGAMVVSKALKGLKPEKLIYAATFGDPKIYLPEGAGLMPAACKGQNLSDYRMYVPDCYAHKGLLGAYVPYEPAALVGKVGVWCNKRDIFCSSRHLNLGDIADHVSYVSDKLYEDASRVIFDKVAKAYGIENKVSSPHDTAILIDSTGSMASMIEKYKNEARRLAAETWASGGRVALYDYRDLGDPYTPVEHCSFETCTQEVFEAEIDAIRTDGGGDEAESLLSASLHVMRSLKWKYGSTKSLVVLTDANFLSPDRDGATFDEVVALSKQIDPVNFYIITESGVGEKYLELASATDGKVVTNFEELSLLTDYIMERYDSLPRVEEFGGEVILPRVVVTGAEREGNGVKVAFETTGSRVMVLFNDAVLGFADGNEIVVDGLDWSVENKLILAPFSDDTRGESVEVDLNGMGMGVALPALTVIPKAPNTGKVK